METKTRKTTMIGAALAVAIIALAGAGYAAVTQYTATTTNTDNYMDATYLTLTQDGAGAYTEDFLANIYFDSLNTATDTTTYTPVYTHDSTYNVATTGATLALISKPLSLDIVPTNSDAATVNVAVTVTELTPTADLTYTMVLGTYGTGEAASTFTKVTNGEATYTTGSEQVGDEGWFFNAVPLLTETVSGKTVAQETVWYVLLFVSAPSTGVAIADTGFPATGETPATFTFKVTAAVTASGN